MNYSKNIFLYYNLIKKQNKQKKQNKISYRSISDNIYAGTDILSAKRYRPANTGQALVVLYLTKIFRYMYLAGNISIFSTLNLYSIAM